MTGPALTPIERAAMTALLTGEHPLLSKLRSQLETATVRSREFTGAGFFTDFAVDPTMAPASSRPRVVLGDVYGELEELQYPVGFLLFVDSGRIETLECFIHDDAWPEHATLKRLYYVRKADNANPTMLRETGERDLGWLREEAGQSE